jgi:hypothetical protein
MRRDVRRTSNWHSFLQMQFVGFVFLLAQVAFCEQIGALYPRARMRSIGYAGY